MPPVPAPALRVKSRWFRSDRSHAPAQQASAMAFIVWRAAQQLLRRMRAADFDVDTGAPYFAFLREVLVFLVAVVDRLAAARLGDADRVAFTTALVQHLARTLADNEDELLGPPPAGAAPHAHRFIDLVNELAPHYAQFGADPQPADPQAGFTPDFAFMRYLGSRLEATLPPKDRLWVIDQVIAIEAPDAVAVVQRAMRELHDPAPRPRRPAAAGGD